VGVAVGVTSMGVTGKMQEDNSRHSTAVMETSCNLDFIVGFIVDFIVRLLT